MTSQDSVGVCLIGRVIGLCLLQNEICPLYLSRPVLKYILGRPIKWHDLAFQDPTLYESLRKLLADTELKDAAQILSALDLSFTIDDEVCYFFIYISAAYTLQYTICIRFCFSVETYYKCFSSKAMTNFVEYKFN